MKDADTAKMQVAVAAGVIGGIVIGSWALQHMFVVGMTSRERRDIFVYVGGILGVWAASEMFKVDAKWLTVEGLAEKTEALIR